MDTPNGFLQLAAPPVPSFAPARLPSKPDKVLQEVRDLARKELGRIPHFLHAATVNGKWRWQCIEPRYRAGQWDMRVTWFGIDSPNFEGLYAGFCIPGAAVVTPIEHGVLLEWQEVEAGTQAGAMQ